MPPEQPPEPWGSFLAELDARAGAETELHCLGGFAAAMLYGLPRPTADVDVITTVPGEAAARLLELAGRGSALHRRHGVYLDFVTVATVPEDYDRRLVEIFPGAFERLRMFALDPYDLALAKLERNSQRDRDDVKFLARAVPLDLGVLRARYEKELRPYLGNPRREDLTLRLWEEAIGEGRGG